MKHHNNPYKSSNNFKLLGIVKLSCLFLLNKFIIFFLFFYAITGQSMEGCTVSVNGGVQFGQYNPFLSEDKIARGYVTVICSPQVTDYKIVCLSNGDGSENSRQLHYHDNLLRYNLYLDPQGLMPWGDDNSGSSAIVGRGHCSAESPCVHLIYGILFRKQNKTVSGSFHDSVKVVIYTNTADGT